MLGTGDPLRMHVFCSHLAQIWATSNSVPMLSTRVSQEGKGYEAIWSTCGPFRIFSLLRALGTPERAGVMSPFSLNLGRGDSRVNWPLLISSYAF